MENPFEAQGEASIISKILDEHYNGESEEEIAKKLEIPIWYVEQLLFEG